MSGASKISVRPVPASTREAIVAQSRGTGEKPLWRAQAVASSVGGEARGDFAARDVAVTLNDVAEGTLYFAQGEYCAAAALAKGAAGVVCELPAKGPHVLVADSGAALARLGRAARNRTRATVMAVLGFEGERTPAALRRALKLASRGASWATDTENGLDLALARLAADCSHAQFSMDDIAAPEPLRPHLAVVGPATAREAGRRVAASLEAGGAAVLPADHPDFARWRAAAMDAGAQVLGYGGRASAEIRLLDCVAGPFGGFLLTIDMGGQRLCTTIARRADATASLAVLGAMRAAGASLGAAAMVLADEAFNPRAAAA